MVQWCMVQMAVTIRAMDGSDNRAYVQYRNSKLTMLLRDSLRGNTRTFIATVTEDNNCLAESLITLKFAQRAKFIRNSCPYQ